jgi:signal transduction histidine kinase/CheY-like chemotaxis protein
MATVMIVDDRAMNRDLVRTVLGYHGHEVIEAIDGANALGLFASGHPDLVITDVLMPGIDGYELVRAMRANPDMRTIPVVFYTANYLEEEARPIAEACGVSRIIAKSGDITELLTAVEDVLAEAAIAPAAPPNPDPRTFPEYEFSREHLRVLKAKLLERTDELEERRRMEQVIDAALEISDDLSLSATVDRLAAAARTLLRAEWALVEVLDEEGAALARSGDTGEPGRGLITAQLQTHGRRVGYVHVAAPRDRTDFDADDREMLAALAGAAARAIRNAQLYDESCRREAWFGASAQVNSALLGADPTEAMALIAAAARSLSGAEIAWIEIERGGVITVEAADGPRSDRLLNHVLPSADAQLLAAVASRGEPVVIADARLDPRTLVLRGSSLDEIGPLLAVPLMGADRCLGALLIGRALGTPGFGTLDVQMAMAFAGQAALSVEYTEAIIGRERLLLNEDRDRIARDLHDVVIQRLFATGMRLDNLRARLNPEESVLVAQVAGELDETIRDIRTSIFSLRDEGRAGQLRSEIIKLAERTRASVGFMPRVLFEGPIDRLASAGAATHVLAIAGEALSNAARHARASRIDLLLRATPTHLLLRVSDDGIGLPGERTESGLANMRHRALQLGGTLNTQVGIEGAGSSIELLVPLDVAL